MNISRIDKLEYGRHHQSSFLIALSHYLPCHNYDIIIPPFPEIANFSMRYFMLSKVYTDEGSTIKLYHGLSACTGDNPLAKARVLSPRTGRQTMV